MADARQQIFTTIADWQARTGWEIKLFGSTVEPTFTLEVYSSHQDKGTDYHLDLRPYLTETELRIAQRIHQFVEASLQMFFVSLHGEKV